MAEGYCYSNVVWDARALTDPRLTLKFKEFYDGDSVAFVTHIDGLPIQTLVPETERDLVAERKRVKKLQETAEKLSVQLMDKLGLPHNTKLPKVKDLIIACDPLNVARLALLKELGDTLIAAINYEKQQLGSKIVQNAVFGFTGAERKGKLPFIVLMAVITATGRWMIKTCAWYVIRYYKGAAVYGDSVVGTTALLLRHNQKITIRSIENLWNESGAIQDSEGNKQYLNLEGWETWTETGWTKVTRIMRHRTNKQIVRVITSAGRVDVTEDHSLVRVDGKEAKPNEVKLGDSLLHSFPTEWPESVTVGLREALLMGVFMGKGRLIADQWILDFTHPKLPALCQMLYPSAEFSIQVDQIVQVGSTLVELYAAMFYASSKDKVVPDCILNASLRTRSAFWEGYCMTHMDTVGQSDVTALSLFTLTTSLGMRQGSDKIKQLKRLGPCDGFVYDLTTENHHFQAGVGSLIVHNTDSIMVQVPHIRLPEGATQTEWNTAYFSFFKQLVGELSGLFPKPHDMSLECLSWPYLLYEVKKNYAYQLWEKPEEPKKIKISGIPFVKRDRCEWVREVGTKCVTMILQKKFAELAPYLENNLQRLAAGQIPTELLATSISVKNRSEYKGNPDSLVQVKLAEKIRKRTGLMPASGSRLMFVYVRGSEPARDRGELLDYVKEHNQLVDLEHYLDQIQPILELIFTHHFHIVPVKKMVAECRRNISRFYAISSGHSILNHFKALPVLEPTFAIDEPAVEVDLEDEDEVDIDAEEGDD